MSHPPGSTQLLRQYWLCSLGRTLHPRDCFVTTNLNFYIPSPLSPTSQNPSHLATISLFSVPMSLFLFCLFILFFWILHMSEIIWYLSFFVWLISLSTIPSGSIHVVTNDEILFWGPSNISLYRCTTSSKWPLILILNHTSESLSLLTYTVLK